MDDIELARELKQAGIDCMKADHSIVGLSDRYWLAVASRAKAIHAERDEEIRRLAERINCARPACREHDCLIARDILALLTPKELT